jgi:hypothetical protein
VNDNKLEATLEAYRELLSVAVLPYQQERLELAIASIQRKLDKVGN